MKDDADLLHEIAVEMLTLSGALEKSERPKLLALCERLVSIAVHLVEGTPERVPEKDGAALLALLRKALPYVDAAGETTPERLRAHRLSVLIRTKLSSE